MKLKTEVLILNLSKAKYNEIIKKYNERWKDDKFLESLDKKIEHGNLKNFADKNQKLRFETAKKGAITFLNLKIKPILKDCVKLNSSKKMVLLRLKILKKPINKGNEIQKARMQTLNGYIDTMIEIIGEKL